MRTAAAQRLGMALLGVAAAVSGLGCGSDTSGPEYWDSPDSAYKVLENLELAYNRMDLQSYMSCFREDFEFVYYRSEWGDSSWGYDVEEQFHGIIFDSGYVTGIDLELEIPDAVPLGPHNQLFQCVFALDAVTIDSTSIRAEGGAEFICTQDSVTGEWLVWKWYDYSEKNLTVTWAEFKGIF